MQDISGWIWFVCGGCLGIVLAAVGMALVFVQERKEWKINFKRKDLHCAYLIGFEDGRKWGYGDVWKMNEKPAIVRRRCDVPMARHKGLLRVCDKRCRTCLACIEVDEFGQESHVGLRNGSELMRIRNAVELSRRRRR